MVTQPKCDKINTSKLMVFSPLPSVLIFLYHSQHMLCLRTCMVLSQLAHQQVWDYPTVWPKGESEDQKLLSLREAASSPGQLWSPGVAMSEGSWAGFPALPSWTLALLSYLSWVAPQLRHSCCCHQFQHCWPSHWPCFQHLLSSFQSTGVCRRCIWVEEQGREPISICCSSMPHLSPSVIAAPPVWMIVGTTPQIIIIILSSSHFPSEYTMCPILKCKYMWYVKIKLTSCK